MLAYRPILPSCPHFSGFQILSQFPAVNLSPFLNCRRLTAWTSTLPPLTAALLSYSWQLSAVPIPCALHSSAQARFLPISGSCPRSCQVWQELPGVNSTPFLSLPVESDLQLHPFLPESVRSGNFLVVLPAVGKRSRSSLLMTSFQLAACCACFPSPPNYCSQGPAEMGRKTNGACVCMTHTNSWHESCTIHALTGQRPNTISNVDLTFVPHCGQHLGSQINLSQSVPTLAWRSPLPQGIMLCHLNASKCLHWRLLDC